MRNEGGRGGCDGRGISELFMCCYSLMAGRAVPCFSTKGRAAVKYGRYKLRQYFVFPPGTQGFSDRNWNNLLHPIIYSPSDAQAHLELVPSEVPTNSSCFTQQTHPMGGAQRNHNILFSKGKVKVTAGASSAAGFYEIHWIPSGKLASCSAARRGEAPEASWEPGFSGYTGSTCPSGQAGRQGRAS